VTAVGKVLVAGAINTDLVARVAKAPEAGETVTGSTFAIFGRPVKARAALIAHITASVPELQKRIRSALGIRWHMYSA